MRKEIRSPNVEKPSAVRLPVSPFGFRHSFGFCHSSFGFETGPASISRLHVHAHHPRRHPRQLLARPVVNKPEKVISARRTQFVWPLRDGAPKTSVRLEGLDFAF